MNHREQFDSAVMYLTWVALTAMSRHGWVTNVSTVINSFNAIEIVGLYIGRPDIEYKYTDQSALLGDVPHLETIADALGAAEQFRNGEITVSWPRRLKRWVLLSTVYRNVKFRYPQG